MPASIKALVSLGICPNAVVSVADDGGSSGLLRSHTGQVPPGDIRKCLVALAEDQQNPWVKAFKERFEYCNNHTLGNLILTALQETTHSLEESIQLCEELLRTKGHVYPASLQSILLMGVTRDGQKLIGQSTLCRSETALEKVVIEPATAGANPAAVQAIEKADLIVLGPGSLFTSVIPNLLLPEIQQALCKSRGTKVFVLSLTDVQGETWGLNAMEHIDALERHGMRGMIDYVLVHNEGEEKAAGNITGYFSALDVKQQADLVKPVHKQQVRPLALDAENIAAIRKQGIKVLQRDLSDQNRPNWHDSDKLARAFASVIADSRGL